MKGFSTRKSRKTIPWIARYNVDPDKRKEIDEIGTIFMMTVQLNTI